MKLFAPSEYRYPGVFAVLGVLFFLPQICGAGESPQWPLDLDTRYLTSNFMEYRSGRFHAGIDLKTKTVSGFAVRAVEDGYVMRVRATPFAYGRAIYVRGVSGKTYVFAHLSRFNDTLRKRVDAARRNSGRYRVRMEFAAGEIPIDKGDVLGLSGESGTGGPHLHFEVRDSRQRPLNPLAQGFPVQDNLAPVFHSLRVIPVAPTTRINGQAESLVLHATNCAGLKGGLVSMQPGLAIDGPVAFSAKIIDHSDIRGHKLEPWMITVTLDGAKVYECRNDAYSFSENSVQRLEWLDIPPGEHEPAILEHWLHNRVENTLPGRCGQPWAGGVGLPSGYHEVVITAFDYAGNETRVILPIEVSSSHASAGAPEMWKPEAVRVVLQTDPDGLPTHWLTPFGPGQAEGSGPFPPLVHLEATKGDPVLASTFLAHVPQEFNQEQHAAAIKQGLKPAGKPVAYLAADWPIDAAVNVPTHLPTNADVSVMAFRWKNSQWKPEKFILSDGAGGESSFPLSTPGVYGFFQDDNPPIIGSAKATIPVKNAGKVQVHGITMPRWQPFALSIVDAGVGLAPETIKTMLDDQVIIVEPDLPRDRLLVVLPDDTAIGTHILKVEAADEAGNLSIREFTIEVSR